MQAHIELPPWGRISDWKAANAGIAYIVRRYKGHPELEQSAAALKQTLAGLSGDLESLCKTTCPQCKDSCCARATVWFDFKDLIFIHLTGQPVPKSQLIKKQKDTCRYLGQNGCSLERLSRPWICTWYICPLQKQIIRQWDKEKQYQFNRAVDTLKANRVKMEDLYIKMSC